jgi:hypothetical protein
MITDLNQSCRSNQLSRGVLSSAPKDEIHLEKKNFVRKRVSGNYKFKTG